MNNCVSIKLWNPTIYILTQVYYNGKIKKYNQEVPLWNMKNYITPETIKKNANDVYQKAVNENIKMFDEFKEQGIAEEDLIYFYISIHLKKPLMVEL